MDRQNIIKQQLGEEIDLKEELIEEDEKLILSDRIYENEKFEEFSKNVDIKIEETDVLFGKKLQVGYIDKRNDHIKLEKKEAQVPFIDLAAEEIDVKKEPIEQDEKLIINSIIYENQFEKFAKNINIKVEESDILFKEEVQIEYMDKCNDDVKFQKKDTDQLPFIEIYMKNKAIHDKELVLNHIANENDKLKKFDKNVDFKVKGPNNILYKEKSKVNHINKYNDEVKLEKEETDPILFFEVDVKEESIEQHEKSILCDTSNENDKLKELNVGIKVEETDILCKEESQINYVNKYNNKIKSRKKKVNQQHEFGLISLKTISESTKDEVPTSNTFKSSNCINQTDLNDEEIGSDNGIDIDSYTVDKSNLKQGHNCFKFKNIKSDYKFKLIDTGEVCDLCKYEQKLNINKEIIKKYQASTDKTFSCQKCDYFTYNRSNMKKHLVVHDNVRPFMCNSCNKRFKRNGDLRSHTCIYIRNRSFQGKAEECKCSKYKAGPSTQAVKESSKHCRCDISGLDNGLKKHIQDKWAVITKQITSVI